MSSEGGCVVWSAYQMLEGGGGGGASLAWKGGGGGGRYLSSGKASGSVCS